MGKFQVGIGIRNFSLLGKVAKEALWKVAKKGPFREVCNKTKNNIRDGTHWYQGEPAGTSENTLVPMGTHWYPLVLTGTNW